jgi:hypothetical protein
MGEREVADATRAISCASADTQHMARRIEQNVPRTKFFLHSRTYTASAGGPNFTARSKLTVFIALPRYRAPVGDALNRSRYL